jgi:Ca2+/Na+ antiporter
MSPVGALWEPLAPLVNFLSRPEILFVVSIVALLASLKWAHVWTEPRVALPLAAVLVLFTVVAAGHPQIQRTMALPDNIPIVIVLVALFFLYWLALRQAVRNDARIAAGQPPAEAAEKNRKVLVWPDLVYTELIAMVVCTVVLVVWSILLKAPLEEPANAARTPNPAKAPWYFLGLQEILVYFDPWWAGVGLPATIMMGLIAIPYVDRNPKGNGYFTLRERKSAIAIFLFGFFVLWVLLAFVGTFLRGYGWNFFGLFQDWDEAYVPNLKNIDLSEIVWVQILGMAREPEPWYLRELWGFLAIGFYMGVLPVILALTVLRRLFRELGALRFGVVVNLGLLMLALPIKMVLRWTLNLKYIVELPEILLNI